MKHSVLNGSERTDGCFAAAFFKTQHASLPACAHERQNNRTATCHHRLPFQATANVMDLGFIILDSERLITELD